MGLIIIIIINIHNWRQIKEKLRNANSSKKSFSWLKKGGYHGLEQEVIEYVQKKRNESLPITWEVIRMKALELKCWFFTNRWHWRYGIQSECGLVHADDEMSRAYIVAPNNSHTALPAEYTEKIISFQCYMVKLVRELLQTVKLINNIWMRERFVFELVYVSQTTGFSSIRPFSSLMAVTFIVHTMHVVVRCYDHKNLLVTAFWEWYYFPYI